jgi:hypothetical protein
MKIEKMIEQHEKMWAAFEQLNEKLELIDVTTITDSAPQFIVAEKPYEPKIGDMCIFWDSVKDTAICSILNKIDYNLPYPYGNSSSNVFRFCIPFESVEQYKKFINEER